MSRFLFYIIILMGCENSFENSFCVSTGTNQSTNYDAYIKVTAEEVLIDSHWNLLDQALANSHPFTVVPDSVGINKISVEIPESIPQSIFDSTLWDDYTAKCIACGRCNFV